MLAIGIISSVTKNKSNSKFEIENTQTNTSTKSYSNTIVCQIKGEVKRPGVYSLKEGSRLQDLIDAAGGLTSSADTSNLNLVLILNDSSCYVVNKVQTNAVEEPSKLININIASISELMSLSGIGEAKAKAIIEYRETNGMFNSVYDLLNVKGISESILNKIIDYICVA